MADLLRAKDSPRFCCGRFIADHNLNLIDPIWLKWTFTGLPRLRIMIRVIVDPNSKCLWQTSRVRVNHDPIYNFIPEPINPKCLPQKKIRLSRRMLMIWTFQADWQSLQYLSSPKSWLDSSIPRSVVYHKARLTSQCRELLFQGVPNCLKMWVMFMKT